MLLEVGFRNESILNRKQFLYEWSQQEYIKPYSFIKIKPGRYKVRLLFFETTYPGTNSPSETQVEFEITTQIAKMAQSNINLHKRNSGFTYQCSKNSPKGLNSLEDVEDIDALRELL